MSRRRVGRVSPVSAISPSAPVETGQTNSILSDPNGRWVAKRQSDISDGLEQQRIEKGRREFDDVGLGLSRAWAEQLEEPANREDDRHLKFSGESKRIGTGTWGNKTPFGKNVGYL